MRMVDGSLEFVVVTVHRSAAERDVQVAFADPEDASDYPFAFSCDAPSGTFTVGQRVRFVPDMDETRSLPDPVRNALMHVEHARFCGAAYGDDCSCGLTEALISTGLYRNEGEARER